MMLTSMLSSAKDNIQGSGGSSSGMYRRQNIKEWFSHNPASDIRINNYSGICRHKTGYIWTWVKYMYHLLSSSC